MALRRDLELLAVGALTALGLSLATSGELPQRPPPERDRQPAADPARLPNGAGHQAATPSDIPARGWWQIIKRVGGNLTEDRVLAEAAGVTFYALLALFPAMAALVSLYGLFADPSTIEAQVKSLSGVLPGGGMDIITGELHSLASKGPTALGFGLVFGLATSLWSANAGIKALFDALNVVYEEHETRSYLRLLGISMVFTLGAMAFIIVALASIVVLPAALGAIGLGSVAKVLLQLLRWPILLLVVTGFLSFVYRYGPSRAKARWAWVSWGSAAAAILWVIASFGFSFYVANFGSYNKTYGSLGAAVGFMTWIWISVSIVLLGAELNAEMEHQTARDTTGQGKPLGLRGAKKADTVATA